MKTNIVCVGKIKEKYLADAIDEYAKRLSKYCDLNIIECKEVTTFKTPNESEIKRILNDEANEIKKYLIGYKIAMDIGGEEVSSPQFADLIKYSRDKFSGFTAVIGGSYGLSCEVKSLCDKKISFGRVTFPHQLMRVIMLEQTYRGYSILSGSEYHK